MRNNTQNNLNVSETPKVISVAIKIIQWVISFFAMLVTIVCEVQFMQPGFNVHISIIPAITLILVILYFSRTSCKIVTISSLSQKDPAFQNHKHFQCSDLKTNKKLRGNSSLLGKKRRWEKALFVPGKQDSLRSTSKARKISDIINISLWKIFSSVLKSNISRIDFKVKFCKILLDLCAKRIT